MALGEIERDMGLNFMSFGPPELLNVAQAAILLIAFVFISLERYYVIEAYRNKIRFKYKAYYAKTRYWAQVQATHPQVTVGQRKVLNKLFDAQPTGLNAQTRGFEGGLSTEKYVAITQVSRATAYRELTQLLLVGLLVKTGQGKATRYALVPENYAVLGF
jgi:hypothetical protein